MYKTTTNAIEVSVVPDFLNEQSNPDANQYFWSYTIAITNLGKMPVQLLSRHWQITDGNGIMREVKGAGVIGQQPVISPSECFEYTSGCPLETPQGFMVGTYEMRDHTGHLFTINIPAFSLDSPFCKRVLN